MTQRSDRTCEYQARIATMTTRVIIINAHNFSACPITSRVPWVASSTII